MEFLFPFQPREAFFAFFSARFSFRLLVGAFFDSFLMVFSWPMVYGILIR